MAEKLGAGRNNIFHQEAVAFNKAGLLGKAARIGVVGVSLMEIYIATNCAAHCHRDPCYNCDEEK